MLHNAGRKHGRYYLVHGHYVDYTETALVNFCAKEPKIRDAVAVGRYYYEKIDAYLTFVATMKKVEPDNVELLTLWHLFFAQTHPDFFESLAARQIFVNRLLTNLYGHYAATYQKFATRMARISTLLYQFRATRQAMDEVDVFIRLNSRPRFSDAPACWHHRFVTTCPDYANCTLVQKVCLFCE
ncbi:hypothetical protein AAVH_25552 [Aphelenchoides avenae]|nr:hypothetical protein AAVH_25552 [Aphelenchus avenae]